MKKYKIINQNIYNFDKKSFIIEVSIISSQVRSLEEIRNGKIIRISQNGNKVLILLLATIYVITIKILLCFI